MRIEIIPYQKSHALEIVEENLRLQDKWLSEFPDFRNWAEGWEKEGPAFTLIIDEKIVGCAGVTIMNWNNGEAWALLSTLFYKFKKSTIKGIKNGLEFIIKENKLKLVQSWVLDGKEKSFCGHFLEHLGFENKTPEGLKNYGPNGETMFLYIRT